MERDDEAILKLEESNSEGTREATKDINIATWIDDDHIRVNYWELKDNTCQEFVIRIILKAFQEAQTDKEKLMKDYTDIKSKSSLKGSLLTGLGLAAVVTGPRQWSHHSGKGTATMVLRRQ
ncbi:hypothetical protein HAX54_014703 [Datura stramonium]|uniref:Uncharacterized protein n=1 Tax=Datura stramonium TaxID=4076 RepID=A0ABS8RZJ2_DATST|nr:hypothetical protein [Datura stramonium]